MLFFIFMQLACFYKGGMVFSPWFNYGMYAAVIKPLPEYELYKVYSNGRVMAGNQYSPQQWDNIHNKLLQADATACNAHFYETEIQRLFKKFHLPEPGQKFYINTRFNPHEIKALYPVQIAKTFSSQVVQVVPLRYKWNGEAFIVQDTLKAIGSTSFLCK